MNTFLNRARDRWQALSTRERVLALVASAVVVFAGAWATHDWQQRERVRLQVALPAAETRLNTMRKLADEFQQYAALGKSGARAHASADAVLGALKAKGLALESGGATAGQLALKGKVPFDLWVDGLATLPAQGWRVERANVQASADGATSAGFVQIDVLLVAAN